MNKILYKVILLDSIQLNENNFIDRNNTKYIYVESGQASTIEFFRNKNNNNNISLKYNNKNYTLKNFLMLPDAKWIIDDIYRKIKYEYPNYMSGNNKFEIVGNFIKNYFDGNDNTLDVIMLNNGNILKFNFD